MIDSYTINYRSQDTKSTLIIGLGTGRCGTVSLVNTLNQLNSSFFVHEGFMLPWDGSKAAVLSALKHFIKESYSGTVGDVGFYWLPYVEHVLQEFPETMFICIKRDKEATIHSYLKKTEGRNHWIAHDGTKWQFDSKWDRCFPKFDVESKEEALKLYWETYYERAAELEKKFPDNFKVFDISVLSDRDSFKSVLDFIGITQSNIQVCHDNAITVSPTNESKSLLARLKERWFNEKKILPWRMEQLVAQRGGVKNTIFSAPLRRIKLSRTIRKNCKDDSLTVVIAVRDRAGMMLYHALDSIAQQNYTDGQITCKVVDYGSTKDYAKEIKAITEQFGFQYLRCDVEGEWSRGRALNIGIRSTNSTFILTSDADIIFSPHFCTSAVEALKKKPLGVVYSYCLDLPEKLNDHLEKKFQDNESIDISSIAQKGSKRWADRVSYGINLTYRENYSMINGYDEKYVGWGGEDDDLFQRFFLLGLDPIVLYEEEAFYLHIWHPKYGGVLTEKKWLKQQKNKLYYENTCSLIRNDKDWGLIDV